MSRDIDKKKKELDILNKAINSGISSDCEMTRLFSQCLKHSKIIEKEVPDFLLINDDESICYGIEHFRVDHHIKEQHGKIGAASVTFAADNERIRQRYNNSDFDKNIITALDELDQNVEKELSRQFNATIDDLLDSFKYMLNKKSNRIEHYRENLVQAVPDDYEGKTVLLVQIVTEFSYLFRCSYRKYERNTSGLMPMFKEVVELLKSECLRDVDYYVLFLESYFGKETKTIVLDNRCIDKSLEMNDVSVVMNCTVDRFLKCSSKMDIKMEHAIENESVIQVPYSVNYRQSKEELYIPAVMTAAKEAMFYKDRRLDFVTEYCVLYFIDVFGPNVKGWKKYKDTDLYECLPIDIDKRVIRRRSNKFDLMYPLKKTTNSI